MSDVAISVAGLGKRYRIGRESPPARTWLGRAGKRRVLRALKFTIQRASAGDVEDIGKNSLFQKLAACGHRFGNHRADGRSTLLPWSVAPA